MSSLVARRASTSNRLLPCSDRVSSGLAANGCQSSDALTIVYPGVGVSFGANLGPPWTVLAMSDGVWKYVGWERVIETVRRERGAALLADLQRAARLPGSGRFQDDFTVVLLEFGPTESDAG